MIAFLHVYIERRRKIARARERAERSERYTMRQNEREEGREGVREYRERE